MDSLSPRHYILRRGATDGLTLGCVFLALFYSSVYGVGSLTLSFLSLALFFSVPFVAYRMLRRSYLDAPFHLAFSAVWLEGIITFICGALLLSVGVFVFFKWLDPDYIKNLFAQYLALADANDMQTPLTDTIRSMMKVNFIPKPVDMVMSSLWGVAFSGSILCLILTPIARRNHPKYNNYA